MRRCSTFGAGRGVEVSLRTGAVTNSVMNSRRNHGAQLALLVGIAWLAGCSTVPGVLPVESLTNGFELMGRAAGMFQIATDKPVDKPTAEQLRRELSGHLKLLDNVKPLKRSDV